jgi:hypothetical protein
MQPGWRPGRRRRQQWCASGQLLQLQLQRQWQLLQLPGACSHAQQLQLQLQPRHWQAPLAQQHPEQQQCLLLLLLLLHYPLLPLLPLLHWAPPPMAPLQTLWSPTVPWSACQWLWTWATVAAAWPQLHALCSPAHWQPV